MSLIRGSPPTPPITTACYVNLCNGTLLISVRKNTNKSNLAIERSPGARTATQTDCTYGRDFHNLMVPSTATEKIPSVVNFDNIWTCFGVPVGPFTMHRWQGARPCDVTYITFANFNGPTIGTGTQRDADISHGDTPKQLVNVLCECAIELWRMRDTKTAVVRKRDR